MLANVNVLDCAMQIPKFRLHLHVMPMSGAVHQRRAPELTTQTSDKPGTTKGTEYDREGKRAARTSKGGKDTGSCRGVKERIGL